MGYNKKQLKESTKPLYDFGGKRIDPVRVITLPISFGTPKNSRTEYITFDVVDMLYPYNAIFGRDLLNTFEGALHTTYLCLKVPATVGVITVFSSQKEARNIERGFCFRAQERAFPERRCRSTRAAFTQTKNISRIQENNRSQR
jgi:hypothetical protein